jgi:hypothetical protein
MALSRSILFLCGFSLLLGVPSAAIGRQRHDPLEERQIAQCIRLASAGKPWLEKTLWGLRDQEGGWIGAAVPNTNGTRDLGPLQVNSWWVPRIATLVRRPAEHVRYWLRHDPCFNAEVARWIFLSALDHSGDFWSAVGIYHSPTAWRQRGYAASVADKLKRRFGSRLFSAAPAGLPSFHAVAPHSCWTMVRHRHCRISKWHWPRRMIVGGQGTNSGRIG